MGKIIGNLKPSRAADAIFYCGAIIVVFTLVFRPATFLGSVIATGFGVCSMAFALGMTLVAGIKENKAKKKLNEVKK